MRDSPYRLVPVAIDKIQYLARSANLLRNPYAVALEHALERLITILEGRHQRRVVVIAERRGKREDADLQESFQRLVSLGTSAVRPERVQAITWTLTFVPKQMNCIGHQIADLAAAPIGSHVLNVLRNRQTNDRAYDIIRNKMDIPTLEILPGKET